MAVERWYPINLALSSEAVIDNLMNRLQMVLINGVPGDIVEMGCHAGDTSVFLSRMIQELDPTRKLHLYDSFQGLPEKDMAKDNPTYGEPGSVKTAKEVVLNRFAKEGLPTPEIHAGWFSDLRDSDLPEKVAFAFFDGDFYPSIMDSFVKIYPRVSQGGVICVHDFGVKEWPGVNAACDEYLADKPEKVESACYLLGSMVKR